MPKLKTNFLGIDFENPLIIPSGILQEVNQHELAEKYGLGGVTTKSMTVEPREGNPIPRVIKYECGILNSVGLRNPGIKKGARLWGEFIKKTKIPVICSVFAVKIKEFVLLAEEVKKIKPEIIELNLSCPNAVDELGEPLGTGVESTYKVVKAVRKAVGKEVKLMAKLSPNVSDIGEIARAAEKAGVDAISAINTVGPGMVINIDTRKPMLGNIVGGVSGPGIRPIAVRCVWDIYKKVKLPILGMGGVSNGKDVIEMMMAGASLVGIGSAWYAQGFGVYEKIKKELLEYMQKNKIKSLKKLVGVAHG
ncbi:MAG: dihydroorotate dehydrogenase [Candidatus Beckwithbacteria bacterium]